MRNLKYAILGFLNQSPRSGYELMQLFEGALSEFWHAKHSQIYPELKRLTQEGMVEYQVQIVGTSLEKKVYSITEKGRQDFSAWLRTREELQPTPKDVFRLRLFFAKELRADERRELILDQLQKHEERLKNLQKNKENFGPVEEGVSDSFCDFLVLTGAIMREETHCEWLRTCLRLCGERETDESTNENPIM